MKLKTVRQDLRLTQEAVAQEMCITRNGVASQETRKMLNIKTAGRYAEALSRAANTQVLPIDLLDF